MAETAFSRWWEVNETITNRHHPAISIMAACLTWNEIIRRSECYLPVNIPKLLYR